MRHFKTPNGKIHGFESDGSQDHLIKDDMVPLTEDEEAALRPAPLTLSDLKQAKINEINEEYTRVMQPFVASYPEIETMAWPQQRAEAAQYLRWYQGTQWNDPPDTETLDSILAGRNADGGAETLAELSEKVLKHANRFTLIQTMTGHRHRFEKQVEEAASREALDAITPNFAEILAQGELL